MANRNGSISVTVRGDREVERAFDKLPAEAKAQLRRGLAGLAGRFTQLIRAEAAADSKPARRAATTVRSSVVGAGVQVTAGPHPLLFLSEFGMNKHTGWYGKPRYWKGGPNAPHAHPGGGSSYWFFRTVEEHRDAVDDRAREIADAVVHNWGA
jgi:hypothetical protein